MFSLFIIFIIISCITLPIALKQTSKSIRNNKPKIQVWWMLLLVAMGISIVMFANFSLKFSTAPAVKMADFEDGCSIYFDDTKNEYFIISQNLFKIHPMYEKYPIDTELAEKKLYISQHRYDDAFEEVETFEEWKEGNHK